MATNLDLVIKFLWINFFFALFTLSLCESDIKKHSNIADHQSLLFRSLERIDQSTFTPKDNAFLKKYNELSTIRDHVHHVGHRFRQARRFWRHAQRQHKKLSRQRRDTQRSSENPSIKIIVHLGRAQTQIQDFTKLNLDVCPPSLCRVADERSRGRGGRPRGTGGTPFYQGDIVLDNRLGSIIFPDDPNETTPAEQIVMNRGSQRSLSHGRQGRRGRRRNGSSRGEKTGGRKRARSRQNRRGRREKTDSKSVELSKTTRRSRRHNRHKHTNRHNHHREEGKQSKQRSQNANRRVKRDTFGAIKSGENEAQVSTNQNLRTEERSSRRKRATMKQRRRLWSKGVVVYRWGRSISGAAKQVLQRAMRHIEQRTCIKFREKTTDDKDFIRFISEPGCWSQIGRVGGAQMVSLGEGCETLGTAVHEIVHALGVWHEQARPDRNRYVKILKENISQKFLPDFEIVSRRLSTDRGYPYDYQSLMHYSPMAFTRNAEPTIKVIGVGRELKLNIGQRRGLSTIDISQLRDMYKCNLQTDINATVCQRGWQKHDMSCYKFVTSSPSQFTAAYSSCKAEKSNLVAIETSREQRFIDKYLEKNHPQQYRWRTAGKLVDGVMKWYFGEKSSKNITKFNKWAPGHPGSRDALVLTRDSRSGQVTWQGEVADNSRYSRYYRHPFICEKSATRRCSDLRYKDGRDYRGYLDHTRDGHTCQKWTENYPHNHPLYNASRAAMMAARAAGKSGGSDGDADGLGNHNKCRNPSGLRRNRPWCYTTKRRKEWGYCDVSVCQGYLRRNGAQGDRGDRATSRSGSSTGSRRSGSTGSARTGSTGSARSGGRSRGESSSSGGGSSSSSSSSSSSLSETRINIGERGRISTSVTNSRNWWDRIYRRGQRNIYTRERTSLRRSNGI